MLYSNISDDQVLSTEVKYNPKVNILPRVTKYTPHQKAKKEVKDFISRSVDKLE